MSKFYSILLLINLLSFAVDAQGRLENFVMFSKEDVPAFSIKKIYEDSRGYIWVCSKNGLFRYDGFEFSPFYSFYDDSTTLTSNSVNDVQEDADGNLWIATASNGVVKMNPFTGKMKQYPVLTPSVYPVYPVEDIFMDEDKVLWFGTGGRGIARYIPEKDSFVNYIVDKDRISDGTVRYQNAVKELAADPLDKNILWAAGMEGLYRFNKTTSAIEKFEYKNPGEKRWSDNFFHCIYIEDLQNIWLGTWGGGLIKFNYTTRKFEQYLLDRQGYANDVSGKNIILDILPKSVTELYICSPDAGFVAFEKSNKKFYPLITKNKMPGSTLYAISATKTKNGSIWVSGEDFIFLGNPLYNRFPNALNLGLYADGKDDYSFLKNVAYNAKEEKFVLAFANDKPLPELDAGLAVFRHIPVSGHTIFSVFFDQNGRLYAGAATAPYLMYMDEGMHTLQPVKAKPGEKDKFPEGMIARRMKFDGNNNVWISGNNNKLIRWNILDSTIQGFTISVSKESGLPNKVFINDMATDRFLNVWLATSSGLFSFDNKTEKISHYYAGGKSSADLATNFITVVAVDKGNRIWIAPQYQGLQVFDPIQKKIVHNYSAGRGSPANHVDAITMDSKDNVWCTSNAGLLYYNRITRLWKVFTNRDGLSKNYLTGSIQFAENGKMFLGVDTTVVVFDPYRLPENKNMPVMHITGFDVLGKAFFTDTLPDYKKKIILSHQENRIDISFTGIESLFPDKINFFYRLIGLDDEWKPSDSRKISYGNLVPGAYTFEVKAMNSDGYESRAPATISFTIEKAYWQTAWFIALCVIAFASLLYALYRYRISQLLKLQQVKNKISADLHDDIGSRLTNIQLLTLISKKQSDLDDNAVKHLDSIQEEVLASSEALNEIVSNMRTPEDQAADLSVKLRRHAAQVFELTNTQLKIELEDALVNEKIPPEKRRDLFLIYKEILNNISKHASAENVRIAVKKESKNLLLVITDDGCGFDPALPSTRNGLHIIKERVAKWKGKTIINSSPGKGTTVKIIFPVK